MTRRSWRNGPSNTRDDGASDHASAPGKRTLSQRIAPARASAAPVPPAGSLAPADPLPTASAALDATADPFGLHLPSAADGAAPPSSAVAAAQAAGLGDVSAARLHTGPAAQTAADHQDARAFTIGRDVYFGAGEFAPGTPDGDRLLGHELAHTAQQRDASTSALAAKLRTSTPGDSSELEADAAGDAFAAALAGHQVAAIAISATPATIARDRTHRAPRATGMHAAIKVTAYTAAGDAIQWTSRARWDGALPLLYTGTRASKAWTWDNDGAASVRVNTNENGSGGSAIEPWATAHDAVRVTINVVDLEDVTTLDALDLADYRDPKKRGALAKHRSDTLGHALPEEHAGNDATDDVKPDARPDATRRAPPRGDMGGDRKADSAGPHAPGTTDGAAAETGTGSGDEHRDGVDLGEDVADGVEDGAEAADSDADDAALDAEIGEFLDQLDDNDGGDGDRDGDAPDGRSGADTAPDGTGKGGEDARHGGGQHDPKYSAAPDGVDAAHDDAPGGDKNAPAGRVGGEEGGREGGVRGGGTFSIFGLSIAIPPSLVGAVEVGLIIDSGNVAGFGPKAIQKLAKQATKRSVDRGGAAALRVALKREAAEEAARSLRAIRKEIAEASRTPAKQLTKRQRQILAEWGKLSREETKRAVRIVHWELQRRYFQETAKAVRAEARALRKGIKRAKNPATRADLRARLDRVEQLGDAAEAPPIAGRLPIGHRYAGGEFPRDRLPKRYRDKGLRIDSDGFPDFEPHAYTLPTGRKSVRIEYTGGRDADFVAANAAAGLERTPKNYVWHHHQRVGEMELVPRDLHDAVKHTGGVAVHKHTTGVEDYD